MLFTIGWLMLGLILAAMFILYTRQLDSQYEVHVMGSALLVAALIYVGFALVWGNSVWLTIELGGVLAYGLFWLLAWRASYIWLAVGWGLHPLWDLALHLFGPGHAVVPEWYAIACLSFDLLVAGYIIYRFGDKQANQFSATSA